MPQDWLNLLTDIQNNLGLNTCSVINFVGCWTVFLHLLSEDNFHYKDKGKPERVR